MYSSQEGRRSNNWQPPSSSLPLPLPSSGGQGGGYQQQQEYDTITDDMNRGGGYPPPSNDAAAYAYMRRIDPNGPSESTSTPNNYSPPRSPLGARAARRSRTGTADNMGTSPLMASRRVTTATTSMPSMRSLVVGPQGPEEPLALSSRSFGVGICETDSGSNRSNQTPASYNDVGVPQQQHAQYNATATASSYDSYDHQQQQQPQRPNLLKEASDDTNFLPNAPYSDMSMFTPHGNNEDAAVERAQSIMASHQGKRQASRPSAKAGLPQQPTSKAIEPAMPASRLGRRCLTHRPKRQPDLVRGKVLQHNNPASVNTNPKLAHVECVGCGVTLEISKNAIVVNCPSCSQVHHTAACRIRISR